MNSLIVLCAALAIFALVAAWRSPDVGLFIFVVSISLNGATFDAGPIMVRPEMITLPVLLLALSSAKWTHARLCDTVVTRIPLSLLIWLGTLAISSVFFSLEVEKSLWVTLQITGSVLIFLLVRPTEELKLYLLRIGTIVIGAVCAVSSLGYVAWVTLGAPRNFGVGVADDERLIGFSFEVNVFASQCVCWLALMMVRRHDLGKAHMMFVVPILVSIALAATRAAWVGTALVVVVYAISRLRQRNSGAAALATILASSAGMALLVPRISINASDGLGWRLLNILNFESGTGGYRLNIYSTALADLSQTSRFVMGSGANSFSQFHLYDPYSESAPYLSSIWLAIIYDSGVIGLFAFIGFLGWIIKQSVDRKSAVLVLTVVLLCATTTNIIWFAFPWLVLGILKSRSNVERNKRSKTESVDLVRNGAT